MSKEADLKKTNIIIPGRKKYNSFKEYLKDLEKTMAELHADTMEKVLKGKK